MRIRTAALVAALAIFGLGAAVGIGLAANSISGDSVGLSAEPLSAGEALAPTTDDGADAAVRERRAQRRRAERRRARREAQANQRKQTDAGNGPTDTAPTAVDGDPSDDDGQGRGRGRGRSDGDSGSSGSGSDDSGSDDSGGDDDSSGHGSGDDD